MRNMQIPKIDDVFDKEKSAFVVLGKYCPFPDFASILWHYTDIQGFKGIFEKKEIWASSIRFLNDKKEIFHGLEMAKTALETFLPAAMKIEKDPQPLEVSIRNTLKNLRLVFLLPSDFFVVSFCENGDLLSQWRGYGDNIHKSRISIGFKFDYLLKITESLAQLYGSSRICSIIYDINTQLEIMKFIINYELKKHGLETKIDDSSIFQNTYEQALILSISCMLADLKHYKFQEEQECRIAVQVDLSDRRILYRPCNNYLVPFIKLPIESSGVELQNGIDSIIIGPGDDQNLVKSSIRHFLVNKGFTDPDKIIKTSEVPYRS